jgi:ribosome-associated protein
MPTLSVRNDHITLAQAVKAAGMVDSGGEAKHLVRSGMVTVNGLASISTVVSSPNRNTVSG